MKNWKTTWDYFVKKYRNQKKFKTGAPAKKKEKYFDDQLSFPMPYVKGNTNTPLQDVEETADVEEPADGEQISITDDIILGVRQQLADYAAEEQRGQNKTKNDHLDIAKTILSANKSSTDLLSQSVNIRREEMTSDKYGNKAFLDSFVPMMDNFPPKVAAYARMKISELFNQLAYEGIPVLPSNVPEFSGSGNSSRSRTPQASRTQEMDEFNLSNFINLN